MLPEVYLPDTPRENYSIVVFVICAEKNYQRDQKRLRVLFRTTWTDGRICTYTMKTKTINKVINAKFDAWLASITDEEVRKKVERGSILTGGAIASMLLQQPVNDYDFYFKDIETARAVAEYYVNQFTQNPPSHFKNDPDRPIKIYVQLDKSTVVADSGDTLEITEKPNTTSQDRVKIVVKSAGVAGEEEKETYQYFEARPPEEAEAFVDGVFAAKGETAAEVAPDYRPVFLSANAISLSGNIQMVIRFYGTPDQIHENYDFVHATNYWTSWERKVVLRTEALECLLTKELRYIGSRYPLCSLIRARKFIQRDWTINAGQFLKISMQISDLNLRDFRVLEEQLVGMDVAYFAQVLSALKEKDPQKVNTAYLTEIIDRIFG